MKDNTLILLLALAGVGGLLWWYTKAKDQEGQPEPASEPEPGYNPLPPIQPFDPERGFGVRVGLDPSYYAFKRAIGGLR
jgi:hypothetical protein